MGRIQLGRAISAIVRIQSALRSLRRATSVRCQPQPWKVGFDSAQKLRVVSGRGAKSHDRRAYSRTRESIGFVWEAAAASSRMRSAVVRLGFLPVYNTCIAPCIHKDRMYKTRH